MAILRKFDALPTICAGALFFNAGQLAQAADLTVQPPAPPAAWIDTLTVSGAVDAGLTINPAYPPNGLNFGRLFTDRANVPLLNQTLLTVERPIDASSAGYDFGFKIQLMYGSDARYTHFLGELDYAIDARNQFDVVEAYSISHLPWLYSGGIDIKIGQFVTLEGAELIPASDNLLYSHSYIFNFGIPLKHTGIMTISHVMPWLDIYAGFDTGVNTTFGNGGGDNNAAGAFHGGFGLNLLDGNLTLLATTHIGPENPDTLATILACLCNPNTANRTLNDATITWKATDKLTFTTDINYIYDDAFKASGYGVAQYASYAINDWLKVVGRAEVWRDANNFFVASYGAPGNFNFVNVLHGFPSNGFPVAGTFAPAPTTYFEATLGVNITPSLPTLPVVKGLIVRPEVRYDTSLNNTTPYNVGRSKSQVTFGGDVIVKF
jgi:hypothetical protein